MKGKRILITGATGGIGRAIALYMAKSGGHFILQGRNEEKLKKIKEEVEELGAIADLWMDDFRFIDSQLPPANGLQFANIDIFVHASGHSLYNMLVDTTDQEWDELFNVHMKSAFRIIKAILPHMVAQRWGRILLISSIWGEVGASCEVAYAAAKGALNAFTKSLAKELAPSGVTVNAIAPGAIETKMVLDHLLEEEINLLKEQIPAGRLGRPEEIASLVQYLTGEESSYITGQIIHVNGGWS